MAGHLFVLLHLGIIFLLQNGSFIGWWLFLSWAFDWNPAHFAMDSKHGESNPGRHKPFSCHKEGTQTRLPSIHNSTCWLEWLIPGLLAQIVAIEPCLEPLQCKALKGVQRPAQSHWAVLILNLVWKKKSCRKGGKLQFAKSHQLHPSIATPKRTTTSLVS